MKNIFKSLFLLLLTASLFACGVISGSDPESLQVRSGLPCFFAKLDKKEPVTIVFLGGSITNHAGYRVQITKWLEERYPDVKFETVNAAIGGTGSDLGVFRTDRDVLEHNPDLVFVEFAVNDAKTDSLVICNSMEGIVRKIRHHNPGTEICFLYTLHMPMLEDLEAGRTYRSIRYMEQIAEYYGISTVDFSKDVMSLLKNDKLVFKGEKNEDYGSRILFTNDGTHPTTEGGHVIYTKTLSTAFMRLSEHKVCTNNNLPPPLYPDNYEKAKMIPAIQFPHTGGWRVIPEDDKAFQYFQGSPDVLPVAIVSSDCDDAITIRFRGTRAGVFDIIGPGSGGLTVCTDGNEPIYIRRFDSYCGDRNRTSYRLFEPLEDGEHTIIIRPDNRVFDKEEIYASNPKRIAEKEYFNEFNTYIGNILLIGDVIETEK